MIMTPRADAQIRASRFAIADGLFCAKRMTLFWREISRNRPIDADSRRNRANFESPKFPFEFKSTIF
jgi:hypothetical protein